MNQSIFVDTAYLVALSNSTDRNHGEARKLATSWKSGKRPLTTTDAVLLEYANFFARSPLRSLVATTLVRLRTAQGWNIVPVERRLLSRAESRYARHADKSWSLTDCYSMEVMADIGLDEVATTDVHFRQAGFRPLMPASR